MALPLLPPNSKASPLIRALRWIALPFGIAYGIKTNAELHRKEKCIQLHDDIIRAKRDRRIAMEREIAMNVEMNKLAEEVGIMNRLPVMMEEHSFSSCPYNAE